MSISPKIDFSESPISRGKNKSKNKINRKFVFILIPVIIALIIPLGLSFFILKSADSSIFEESQHVHIVLKKDNKKYIFHDNSFFLENDLENGTVPTNFGLQQNLLVTDNEFQMTPFGIQGIAAIASGNYKIIPKKENNYDGYVVLNDNQLFETKTQSKAGDKIGSANYFFDIILRKNNPSSDSLVISWQQTPVLKAINNCQEVEVMSYSSPYQGKTVGSLTNIVVTNLNLITQFYQNDSIQLLYDKTDQILYITL